MYISKSLVKNIADSKINQFLRENHCTRTDEEKGQDIDMWLTTLIDTNKINEDQLNEFFFEQIFYGKSNLINIYQIKSCKKLRDEEVWLERLEEMYGIKSINFNALMSTSVNPGTPEKVGAIKTVIDQEGNIKLLRMIIVKYMRIKVNGEECDSACYLPVEFNMQNKLLIIKVRNQYNIVNPEQRPKAVLEKIVIDLKGQMEFETYNYDRKHKKTLYSMSKGLLEEIYKSIPNYNAINGMEEHISAFIETIINNIPLINLEEDEENKPIINQGVIDLNDELKKILQQLIVSDYFLNEDVDIFSQDNISAVITSIKFNDKEKNTAKLAGENNTKAIVCSRTFMSMRKSMEVVETIESLGIAYKRQEDSIEVKYNACEKGHLEILILNQKYYDESDFRKIREVFEKYELRSTPKVTKTSKKNVS